jgi:hypothetical protein
MVVEKLQKNGETFTVVAELKTDQRQAAFEYLRRQEIHCSFARNKC